MAEGLLFNIIEKLIGKLGSMAAESWNVGDNLEKLVENMSEIKAVVLDAEEQQDTSNQVQFWLQKLKDALDDADDLLDDFSTEDLRRQVMTKGKKAKKVRIFLSSSNQLVFSFKMAQKIKELRKTIEALNVDKKIFSFTNRTPDQRVAKQREIHSFIREEEVIGREEERKELVELLLNTNIDAKENVSIISIIGIGGLGKTALAQLVYNDKAVRQHFELKKLVCVSDDFDVKGIAAKITGSKSNELDQVQQELREKVGGKRYLLVLDDIWNEDREHWLQLMTLLKDGAKGSKIIITTRSATVAKIAAGTSSLFFLRGLNAEQSWRLFSQLAFENGDEPENQNLVSIGKKIVEKCSGVPLAIRSIGNLMYTMETEEKWANIRDKELVNINVQGVNTVFELIKLSYDHLPFHLKKCFAFCSLFPKDYDIDTTQLIRLWVAQGFVQSSDESACLEDVGYGYFLNLAHGSFFQDLQIRGFEGHFERCKMHDLVHDVAERVSRNDCVMVNKKAQHVDKETRHISFGFPLDPAWQVPSPLLKAYKLRTFLVSQQVFWVPQSLEDSGYGLVLSSFKKLRALDLKNFDRRKIPSCIGVLKHLRYLDLSHNGKIEVLPGSITKLNNLQTLLLNYCFKLRELPQDLWRLTSLRHLELDDCCTLAFMPSGIGQLTNLQTLTLFVLDTTSKHSGGASELRELNNLRGKLEIKGLEWLRRSPTEAKDFNLLGKSHLQGLTLTWDKQIDADDNDMEKDYIILQELRLHQNIKRLSIKGFGGTTMFCSVPPLHLFLHLTSLSLVDLPCLEWIDNNSSNGSSSTVFPSLEKVFLASLPNLKGWCRCSEEEMPRGCCHQFKTLHSLSISGCPNLISIPQHTDIRSVRLTNVREKILQQAISHSNVEDLWIDEINDLKSLSGFLQHLTTLRELHIRDCEQLDPCNDEDGCYIMQWKELKNLERLQFGRISKMESLPEGLQHVTTLQRLEIWNCANLTFIPEWVTSLQAIDIRRCPKLTSLPEGVKVRRQY